MAVQSSRERNKIFSFPVLGWCKPGTPLRCSPSSPVFHRLEATRPSRLSSPGLLGQVHTRMHTHAYK